MPSRVGYPHSNSATRVCLVFRAQSASFGCCRLTTKFKRYHTAFDHKQAFQLQAQMCRPVSARGLLPVTCLKRGVDLHSPKMPSRYRSRSPVERERSDRVRFVQDEALNLNKTPQRRERSRSPVRRRRSRSRSRSPRRESSKTAVANKQEYGKPAEVPKVEPEEDNTKPNFGLSGKLAAETNTFRGVVLKYNEPPEARKPTKSWRLYVFKGKEQLGELLVST